MFQIIVLIYLLIATQETIRKIILDRRIDIVNQTLHWYFIFYPIFTMVISAISFNMLDTQAIMAVVTIALQFSQGMIVIYLLRNHRFAENNCFKRRFAISQMLNYILQYVVVFVTYQNYEAIYIQFGFAFAYASIQIIDQFYACPYRDPFREPSLKAALILFSIVIIAYIYQSSNQTGQFFWLLFAAGLMSGISNSLSGVSHEFAMSNYNSKTNLQEKYIIIGVDQIFSYYSHFQENDETKILFFQQVSKHKENCTRSKCVTQKIKLQTININDRVELHKLVLDVVSCIFKTCHQRTVIKRGLIFKPKFEQLQLQYISFLSSIAERPLLGYVELRQYQIHQNNSNSLYFRELTSKVSSELEFQILYLQDRMVQQQFRREKYIISEEKLSISSLWKSINFYQQITPQFIAVLEQKTKYWASLIEGYEDLRPLKFNLLNLCKHIDRLYEDIKSSIIIPEIFFDRSKDVSKATVYRTCDIEDRNINVLNLKIYSLLYSVVLNDFDRTFQAEKQIEELIKEDRQKLDDVIDDNAIQKDDALVILLSMVRKRGHIVNKNLTTLANFFEFSNAQDIQNQTQISSFLPPDIARLHDSLLNGFVSNGYTKYSIQSIHSYYVQRQGFLREAYVKINNLFQDADDFILTASILRVQRSNDIVLFDCQGKVIGISEPLFKSFVQESNHSITLERFIDQGFIQLLIPNIFVNMKKMISGQDFLEYIDFIYNIDDLMNVIIQFSFKFQTQGNKYQNQISSYNLSSFKTETVNLVTQFDSSLLDDSPKYQGYPIPMLNKDRILDNLEFLLKFNEGKLSDNRSSRVKYTLQFHSIKTKRDDFPYFICKIETMTDFEKQQSIQTSNYKAMLKKTINIIKNGEQSQTETNFNTATYKFNDVEDKQLMNSQVSSMLIDQPLESYISQVKIPVDGVLFENPVIACEDDQDLIILDQEFQQDLTKIIQDKEIDLKYDSELLEKKSDSSVKKKNDYNLIDILRKNRENRKSQHDPLVQESSKQSSAKTSSSKSPFLMVRQLYQINSRNLNVLKMIFLNLIVAVLLLSLIFVKVQLVQSQYDKLQTNLNYVQDPETINNFYMKATILSYTILQQQLDLIQYSEQINKDIMKELLSLSNNVEQTINNIYYDIEQFETDVIVQGEKIKIVNNLFQFNQDLDLTVLLKQIQLEIIQIYDHFLQTNKLDNKILSSILFLRLNMVQVNNICIEYINFLNLNLNYYEQQITNTLTYIIVVEVIFITLIILLQIQVITEINNYEKRLIVLTTKLSEDDALDYTKILLQVVNILKDPQQILWKQTNYLPIVFEQDKRTHLQKQQAQQIADNAKINMGSTKRRYQNSSLTSRVYHLRLPQTVRLGVLFAMWLIKVSFLLGALGFSFSLISQIKPAITLNLQLIQFKLNFDSIVTFGDISLLDQYTKTTLQQNFQFHNITFDNIDLQFVTLFTGFSDQVSTIYNSLVSSQSLLTDQKQSLIVFFTNNLCTLMNSSIPSCYLDVNSAENSKTYIQSGLVDMVHEITKTIQTYFYHQLDNDGYAYTEQEIIQFLHTSSHITQFTEHFLYQGKSLENISSQMLYFNSQALNSVNTQFQIYIYLLGFSIMIFHIFSMIKWIGSLERKIYLQKLGLTLIPAESLIEQKTLQELKYIQNF